MYGILNKIWDYIRFITKTYCTELNVLKVTLIRSSITEKQRGNKHEEYSKIH